MVLSYNTNGSMNSMSNNFLLFMASPNPFRLFPAEFENSKRKMNLIQASNPWHLSHKTFFFLVS